MLDLYRMRQIIDEELPTIEFAIEKAQSNAEKCTAAWNDMPRGGVVENQVEKDIDVRLMLENEQMQVMQELTAMREELRPGIDSLVDGTERRVMRVRYMCGSGHSLKETASMFGYCERHTRRILQRAENRIMQDVTGCHQKNVECP